MSRFSCSTDRPMIPKTRQGTFMGRYTGLPGRRFTRWENRSLCTKCLKEILSRLSLTQVNKSPAGKPFIALSRTVSKEIVANSLSSPRLSFHQTPLHAFRVGEGASFVSGVTNRILNFLCNSPAASLLLPHYCAAYEGDIINKMTTQTLCETRSV